MSKFAGVTLTDVCEMDSLEEKTLQLLNENPRISPSFLARKLKVRMDTARKLYLWAYQLMGVKAFRERCHISID